MWVRDRENGDGEGGSRDFDKWSKNADARQEGRHQRLVSLFFCFYISNSSVSLPLRSGSSAKLHLPDVVVLPSASFHPLQVVSGSSVYFDSQPDVYVSLMVPRFNANHD